MIKGVQKIFELFIETLARFNISIKSKKREKRRYVGRHKKLKAMPKQRKEKILKKR